MQLIMKDPGSMIHENSIFNFSRIRAGSSENFALLVFILHFHIFFFNLEYFEMTIKSFKKKSYENGPIYLLFNIVLKITLSIRANVLLNGGLLSLSGGR